MNNKDQFDAHEERGTAAAETKGSGHRGDTEVQSRDTSRLERDGHEFPRTGESAQGNQENVGQNQATSEVGVGQGAGSNETMASAPARSQDDTEDHKQHPLGSTNPPESHDSWRPSADPYVGDMAPEEESSDRSRN